MENLQELIPHIRQAIREELSLEIIPRLIKLEKTIQEVSEMKETINNNRTRLDEQEKSITFNGQEIQAITNKTIPDLEAKFNDLTQKVCLNILNLETHRRKWSLIISGIKGIAQESEAATRSNIRVFAKTNLKVEGADSHPMAACHRLANSADAPIIVKFVDLAHRNEWLSGAKHLKNYDGNISVSPDLPPVLRPLKGDILNQRKDLPLDVKSKYHVKYLPRWPFVCLNSHDHPTKNPRITRDFIVNKFLNNQ